MGWLEYELSLLRVWYGTEDLRCGTERATGYTEARVTDAEWVIADAIAAIIQFDSFFTHVSNQHIHVEHEASTFEENFIK